ncbi:hypothetical protein FAVG1_11831 [Fusarium avenaceum]|nr:hypothetical protein FAVG1_11831 [Fusarium avenaceum]
MKLTSFFSTLAVVSYANADEGVYLVNSRKGNEISSGMAYYADINHSHLQQPSAYTDVTHGDHIVWEGRRVTGNFNSGVSLTSTINADAFEKGNNAWVGSGNNGFKDFTCWKTYERAKPVPLLYSVDGWSVFGVYRCSENR